MHSIIDKLLICLPKLLEVDQLIMHCVKLLCLLIDAGKEYSESVLQHLELITINAKTWPMEVSSSEREVGGVAVEGCGSSGFARVALVALILSHFL